MARVPWWEVTCTSWAVLRGGTSVVTRSNSSQSLSRLELTHRAPACRCVCTCGVDMALGFVWSGPLIRAVFSWPSSYPRTAVGTQLQTLIALSGLVSICLAAAPRVIFPAFPAYGFRMWDGGAQHWMHSAVCSLGDVIYAKIGTVQPLVREFVT